MSMENAKKFYEKVKADQDLQQKIGLVAKENPQGIEAVIIKTAKENGFEFSEAEMKTFMNEKGRNLDTNQELNDSQLESVAGGGKDDWVLYSVLTIGTGCGVSELQRQYHDCALDK